MSSEKFVGECGHTFLPKGTAKQLLERVRSGDMPLAIIECPICHSDTPVDALEDTDTEENFRCPMETCAGWVCEVEEDASAFWGCGECGNVWPDRTTLFQAISEIVKKRKYRRKVYVKSGSAWRPAILSKEPRDYEDLVEEERADQ